MRQRPRLAERLLILLVPGMFYACGEQIGPVEIAVPYGGPPVMRSVHSSGCPHNPNGRFPTSSEGDDISNAIDEVDADGCDDMVDWLFSMYDDGRILIYETDEGDYGDIQNWSDPNKTEIHLYVGTFGWNEVENTLRHEYGHYFLQGGSEPDADHFMTNREPPN